MTAKKTFTKKELESLSAEQIIKKIQTENYSLLTTLGGEKLRKEMVPVGKVCTFIVKTFPNLQKLTKGLKKFAPVKYNPKNLPKDAKTGLVIGFNHPSLGEVPRLILLKFEQLSSKSMLFPVNLPWYESIAPLYQDLEKLGIIITPTITPSTWKKLNIPEDNPFYESAKRIKHDFRDLYTNLSENCIKNGGCIMVAPSATRQATVFKNKAVFNKTEEIIPTMSVLALKLYQDPDMNCDFLPIAVQPPENAGRGLNLFKTYTLIPGEPITATEIRKKYIKNHDQKHIEDFDYDFHQKIANELPKKFWY